MPYAPQTWNDDDPATPATAARITHMEDGIAAAIPADLLTTKGDIIVRGASAGTRLPVGTNGQVLTADASTATGVKWAAGGGATGTGSPEGVVTASPGATYTDTAGTGGAWLWVKMSGTGTTGWKVVAGDTGWRNVTGLLSAAPAGGQVWIRRTDSTVTIQVAGLTGSATGLQPELPGFKASVRGSGRLIGWPLYDSGGTYVAGIGRMVVDRFTPNKLTIVPNGTTESHGIAVFLTDDAWPNPLPGTP